MSHGGEPGGQSSGAPPWAVPASAAAPERPRRRMSFIRRNLDRFDTPVTPPAICLATQSLDFLSPVSELQWKRRVSVAPGRWFGL